MNCMKIIDCYHGGDKLRGWHTLDHIGLCDLDHTADICCKYCVAEFRKKTLFLLLLKQRKEECHSKAFVPAGRPKKILKKIKQ